MHAPADSSTDAPPPPKESSSVSRGLLERLYTHNPFYLLSVCCVLHGSSFWMQNRGMTRAEPLIAFVAGYILILAAVAWLIVRFGKVWEDARSILLLIPVLFVEFSLSFDDPLLTNPRTGALWAIGGYGLVVLVTEGLLLGLAIRLPWLLRLPLHAFLGLMMLYPLALTPIRETLSAEVISWRIYSFYPLTACVLLTLIPAIRRGSDSIRDSRTPWRWPWFPWTIFAVLLTGVLVRGYALSLSFDPVLSLGFEAAMNLESAWGLYFLAPVLLAAGWLLLEFGISSSSRKLQQAALAFPILCLCLSIPQFNTSQAHADFLEHLTRGIASPLFLSLIGAAAFYAMAFWKRVPFSDFGLAFVIWLFALIGPETHRWQTTIPLQIEPLILAGGFLVIRGVIVRQSLPVFAGTLLGIGALRFSLPAAWPGFWQNAIGLHLAALAALSVGVAFRDVFARALRFAAALLMIFGCVLALFGTRVLPPDLPAWVPPVYATVLTFAALSLAYWLWNRHFLIAGLLNLVLAGFLLVRETYLSLRSLPEWPGIASFGLAFLLLAIGGGISAAKAGLAERIKNLVPRPSAENKAEQ